MIPYALRLFTGIGEIMSKLENLTAKQKLMRQRTPRKASDPSEEAALDTKCGDLTWLDDYDIHVCDHPLNGPFPTD